jgi:hypothetical protein
VQALPAATSITRAGANAVAQFSGCLADLVGSAGGSHLAINAQNNQQLSTFGGVEQLVLGPSGTHTSSFRLYVDGVRIATTDVTYATPSRP